MDITQKDENEENSNGFKDIKLLFAINFKKHIFCEYYDINLITKFFLKNKENLDENENENENENDDKIKSLNSLETLLTHKKTRERVRDFLIKTFSDKYYIETSNKENKSNRNNLSLKNCLSKKKNFWMFIDNIESI